MKYVKLIVCLSICIFIIGCNKRVFSLEEKYYKDAALYEINYSDLEKLVSDKESFGVFVYQPLCETSAGFETILNNFTKQYQMNFYKVAFSSIKGTDLGKRIKYYPSFIIYKDGKIVDYLEADKNEDTNKYKDINEFTSWISSYINLPKITNEYNKDENTNLKEFDITVNVDNISYDPNKVNIYLFWGDGCPHCENAKIFFDSIENEYGKYYKLNMFEVWSSKTNQEILRQFSTKMSGSEAGGVPYIIIGEDVYSGFNYSYKDSIIKSIMSQYKNSYDVYFK